MLQILKTAWRRWLRFAELLGNVQMTIFLTVIYWTLFMLIAIPFKLLADPLQKRGPGQGRWVHRHPVSDILEAMKKQG